MEMNMEFIRKLPTPAELKEEFPVSKKIAEIKEARDSEIKNIFEGKEDKLILVIGPCSADNEDAVIDYISTLSSSFHQRYFPIIIVSGVHVNTFLL